TLAAPSRRNDGSGSRCPALAVPRTRGHTDGGHRPEVPGLAGARGHGGRLAAPRATPPSNAEKARPTSEGSAIAPHRGVFSVQLDLLLVERAVGLEPFMGVRCTNSVVRRAARCRRSVELGAR